MNFENVAEREGFEVAHSRRMSFGWREGFVLEFFKTFD